MALSRLHKQILDELSVPDDLFIKIMVGVVVVELRDKRFALFFSLSLVSNLFATIKSSMLFCL